MLLSGHLEKVACSISFAMFFRSRPAPVLRKRLMDVLDKQGIFLDDLYCCMDDKSNCRFTPNLCMHSEIIDLDLIGIDLCIVVQIGKSWERSPAR